MSLQNNTADTSTQHATSPKLSLSGISLDLHTILGIIGAAQPVVLAIPAVIDLISAAISVFNSTDKARVEQAYKDKMNATDAAHQETQKVLSEKAAETDISGTDSSPKGGGL